MRVFSRIGSTRAGVWVIGNLISPFQRWVIRTTRGRLTLTSKPVLLLTAIGRRSRVPRTVPLLYLRDDENLVVCNVRPPGERQNPWPLNVRADPDVTIRIRGGTEPRIARDARPEEVERLWPRLVELWPPYERFFARTNERSIFVLEVAEPDSDQGSGAWGTGHVDGEADLAVWRRRSPARPEAQVQSRRVRVAALLLIAGLAAGPVGTHVYWMLGGTWGLQTNGLRDDVATTGVRVVAAVVIVLLVAAVLVVLARVGLWQQAFVSERMIRFFAWALAAVFLLEAVAAFTWGMAPEWWMYGPVSLVIGVLALVVAGSGGAWPHLRPHRTRPSH